MSQPFPFPLPAAPEPLRPSPPLAKPKPRRCAAGCRDKTSTKEIRRHKKNDRPDDFRTFLERGEQRPDPKEKPKTDSQTDAVTKTQAQTRTKTKTEAQAEAEAETQIKTQTERNTEAKANHAIGLQTERIDEPGTGTTTPTDPKIGLTIPASLQAQTESNLASPLSAVTRSQPTIDPSSPRSKNPNDQLQLATPDQLELTSRRDGEPTAPSADAEVSTTNAPLATNAQTLQPNPGDDSHGEQQSLASDHRSKTTLPISPLQGNRSLSDHRAANKGGFPLAAISHGSPTPQTSVVSQTAVAPETSGTPQAIPGTTAGTTAAQGALVATRFEKPTATSRDDSSEDSRQPSHVSGLPTERRAPVSQPSPLTFELVSRFSAESGKHSEKQDSLPPSAQSFEASTPQATSGTMDTMAFQVNAPHPPTAELRAVASSVVHQVADTVATELNTSEENGKRSVSLQISPANLGELQIDITSKDGTVSAQIVASERVTSELLLREVPRLVHTLQEMGVDLQDVGISHQGSQQQFESRHGGNSDSWGARQPHQMPLGSDAPERVVGAPPLHSLGSDQQINVVA